MKNRKQKGVFLDDKLSYKYNTIEDKQVNISLNSLRKRENKNIKIDYLAVQRQKREQDSDYKTRNNERTLDQLMNDNRLNEYEKMDAVKRRADKMER